MIKPYHQIPIVECGEPLVAIPCEQFAVISPHTYIQLGATYGERSPYYLRQTVLDRLIEAQTQLQPLYPGWRILIFDAYRPVEVQQFMVDYTFAQVAQAEGLSVNITDEKRQEILKQVYTIWAVPSLNPATPPPHSTGAAVDITLVDASGNFVDMGGEIDELSGRSHPDYYADAISPTKQQYHTYRQSLNKVMSNAGFRRHPEEWWHFSLGDQMWAWLMNQEQVNAGLTARYGRVYQLTVDNG